MRVPLADDRYKLLRSPCRSVYPFRPGHHDKPRANKLIMKIIWILLWGSTAWLDIAQANTCLDSCEIDAEGTLSLTECEITDADVDAGDLAACLDAAGRDSIIFLDLGRNSLTTLPDGVFLDLTAMESLHIDVNDFGGSLPDGIFQDLPALNKLDIWNSGLTSLSAGTFQGLTTVTKLYLHDNALSTLPEGIFDDPSALEIIWLNDNALVTLPEGVFEGLTALTFLDLIGNALECLPTTSLSAAASSGVDGLHVGTYGTECGCSVTGVTNVCGTETCTPGPDGYTCGAATLAPMVAATPSPVVAATNAPVVAATPAPVVAATPAPMTAPTPAATKAPVPAATPGPSKPTPAPESSSTDVATPAPVLVMTAPTPTAETEAPAPGTLAPQASLAPTVAPTSRGSSTSDSTPIVAGIVSAVAGAALVAAVVLGKRRRDAKQKAAQQQQYPAVQQYPAAFPPPANDDDNLQQKQYPAVQQYPAVPPPPPGNDDDSLEQGTSDPAQLPSYAAALASSGNGDGGHKSAPPPYMPEADGGGAVFPLPPPAVLAGGAAQPSTDRSSAKALAAKSRDAGGLLLLAGGAAEGGTTNTADGPSAAKLTTTDTTSTATNSTANVSTAERAELVEFHRGQVAAADAAPVAGGTPSDQAAAAGAGAPLEGASQQNSAGDIGLGQAVLAAAQELAHSCQVPGISEAAGVLCIMANLFTDSRENDKASESRLRQCRGIVMALRRAEKVVGKGGDTTGETARVLIEDVHDAIFDLVELIKTFQSKNKLSKVFLSTLFKRRKEELDAVVDRAITRLQLGLQLQVGHDMSSVRSNMKSVGDDVSAVKDGVKAVEEGMKLYRQSSIAEATSEAVAEARRIKRQRKLDQVEIPEDHLFITTDMLGKGGFGEVYLADYNGHNAAAKVLYIAHDLGALDENQQQRETRQRRGFLRELEAMIRLRSPNTVNVFGAVTSLPDRMVLVMELLPNGDLLALLRKSKKLLPREQCRGIIGDICAGMAFLHSKDTIHGDLKSANVLLDGDGRAKIADFGTSRWSQHTNSTGLATYTTKANQSTQMSLAWSAPEVLESGGSTYKSDVYSFGIVVWEVLSRELPWANKTRPRDILSAVLMGVRPSFHVDAPSDIVDIAKSCWGGEPEDRTTFDAILEDMKAKGWHE